MVEFLAKLPEVFRERYLNTHETYLKSIADIIGYLYGGKSWEEKCAKTIAHLLGASKMRKRRDIDEETPHFKNLRNCWYNECALNYPPETLDERLRFAAWKIIQCYYVVFSSVASLVCCFHPEIKSHDATLNIFAREFLCHSKRKGYFLPPVNFYLNQQGRFPKEFSKKVNWPYADSYHIPNIINCLKNVQENLRRKKQMVTIPHYLKSLRDWVTYGDAYLFIRLYGKSPKTNLDFSLENIAFIHSVQAEFFLLRLFGWDAVNRQFENFSHQLRSNLEITSAPLAARFKIYSEIGDKL